MGTNVEAATVQALAAQAASAAVNALMQALRDELTAKFEEKLGGSMTRIMGLMDQHAEMKSAVDLMAKEMETMKQEKTPEAIGQQIENRMEKIKEAFESKVHSISAQDGEGIRKLRIRDAEKFMPDTPWDEGAYEFTDFSDDVSSYLAMLDPELDTDKFLKWVDSKEPHELQNLEIPVEGDFPEAISISRQLHAVLLKKTKGEAKTVVKSSGTGEGLAAWRQLTIDNAPRSTNDSSAIMSLIISPVRARTLEELRSRKVEFEKRVKEYEAIEGEMTDKVKEAALKGLVPLDLLESRFRGKKMNGYKNLRKEIDDYIRDKGPEDASKNKKKGAGGGSQLQPFEEEEAKDEASGEAEADSKTV